MKKILLIFFILTLLISCDEENKKDNTGTQSSTENNHIISDENESPVNVVIDKEDDSVEDVIVVDPLIERREALLEKYNYEIIDFISDKKNVSNVELDVTELKEIGLEIRQKNRQRIVAEFGSESLDKNDRLFTNVEIPDGAKIRYVDKAYSGIDWNYSSYLCEFELIVLDNNQLFFSFGHFNESSTADETFELKVEGNVVDTSLSFDDEIFVLSEIDDTYFMNIFSPYGDLLSKTKLVVSDYSDAKIQLFPKGPSEYYLMIQEDSNLVIESYKFEKKYDSNHIHVSTEHALLKRKVVSERVIDIMRNGNMIAVSIKNFDENNEEVKRVICLDYDFDLKYIFEIPLEWELEYLDNPGEDVLSVYYSNDEKLYKQIHKIKDNRLSCVIASGWPWNTYFNGVLYDLDLKGGHGGHYKYWGFNGKLFIRSNNSEKERILCSNGEITRQTFKVDFAGGYHIGTDSNGMIIFVIPENDIYESDYTSPMSRSLIGRYAFDLGITSAYQGGVVFIEKESAALIYVTEDGVIRKETTLDLDTVNYIIEESNDQSYATRDFNDVFVINSYGEFLAYNKTSGESMYEKLPFNLKFRPDIGTYTYAKRYYFDFDTLSFNSDIYYFSRQMYDNFSFDGSIFVNSEITSDEEVDGIKSVSSEFVSVPIFTDNELETKINIVDSKSIIKNDKLIEYILRYEDSLLFEYVKGEYLKQITTSPVRHYSISEHGILYTGYGNQAYTYVYNFAREEVTKLNNKHYTVNQTVTDSYNIVGTREKLQRYSKADLTLEALTVDLDKYVSDDFDWNYELYGFTRGGIEYCIMYMPDERDVLVFEAQSMDLVYNFSASQIYCTDEGIVYYTYGLYTMSYDIEKNKLKMLSDKSFLEFIDFKDDELICVNHDEGYSEYVIIHSEVDMMSDFKEDYILLHHHYYSNLESLYIFDRKNSTIEHLTSNDYYSKFEYKIEEYEIKYRSSELLDGKYQWAEWKIYKMSENSTVKIVK